MNPPRKVVALLACMVIVLGTVGAEGAAIVAGNPAPDFNLPDEARRVVRLSDYRGLQSVILVFYVNNS